MVRGGQFIIKEGPHKLQLQNKLYMRFEKKAEIIKYCLKEINSRFF